jgi:hypothetical protein
LWLLCLEEAEGAEEVWRDREEAALLPSSRRANAAAPPGSSDDDAEPPTPRNMVARARRAEVDKGAMSRSSEQWGVCS